MKAPEVITVDFETKPIEQRPKYPPEPVGVAIKEPGKKPLYLAWGHKIANTCAKEDARRALLKIWKDPRPKLFWNAKFDCDVGEVHLGLPRLSWQKIHDGMFLSFLCDPDRWSQELKMVAKDLLGIEAVERDALKEWIFANIQGAKQRKSEWGKYIWEAPASLVAKYAGQGDAEMTARLFAKLYHDATSRGMSEAYDRERRVMFPLLDAEGRGLRVDERRLEKETPFYERLLQEIDDKLRKILKAPQLDLDKRGTQLADALDKAGVMESWQISEKGNRLTNKKALMAGLSDQRIMGLLFYRSALATSIRTFMLPWRLVARESGGMIFTKWNQVRQESGGDPTGARTGRLSSSPNFQNIPIYTRSTLILPKLYETGINPVSARLLKEFPWAGQGKHSFEIPGKGKVTINNVCPLPMMKGMVLPYQKDHELIERDYSQQEFRILAHYEDGPLLEKYQENPRIDVHDAARDLISSMTGMVLDRRPVKDVGFSLIYGMGLAELARKTEQSIEVATALKKSYLAAMPGLGHLLKALKLRAAERKPITTWGGRQYFCEKPRIIKGRLRTFEYKLINRLVQGSAADCTKESIARYHELPESKRYGGLFLMTVHDSNVNSAPKKQWRLADAALKKVMEEIEFAVPMLTDGKHGSKSLGELVDTED